MLISGGEQRWQDRFLNVNSGLDAERTNTRTCTREWIHHRPIRLLLKVAQLNHVAEIERTRVTVSRNEHCTFTVSDQNLPAGPV